MTMPTEAFGPHGKSGLTRVYRSTVAMLKAHVADIFDTLDNFVILEGEPTVASGKLIGRGAVRYRDQMATDECKRQVRSILKPIGTGVAWRNVVEGHAVAAVGM